MDDRSEVSGIMSEGGTDRRGMEWILADRFEEFRCRPLTPAATGATVEHIIDTVACAAGGFGSATASALRGAIRPNHGSGDGTRVWFGESSTDALNSGLLNGTAARSLDYNDTYLGVNEGRHPSDVIPALWAIAEREHHKPDELLHAIALSYEIDCGLANALDVSSRGIDNVLFGGIGAALATGHLLGLSRSQLVEALRISAASCLYPNKIRWGQLSSWKAVAGPWAARTGVEAALLARSGVTGPTDLFDGKAGIWTLLGFPASPSEEIGARLTSGTVFKIEACSIKAFPTQFHTQSAVECAIGLYPLDVFAVRAVRVRTYQVAYVTASADPEKWQPTSRETADHSLQCCVAIALTYGRVDDELFALGAWHSEDVKRLMAQMEVVVDDKLTSLYPRAAPAVVSIEFSSGEVVERRLDAPLGHPANPMDAESFRSKFSELTIPVLGERGTIDLFDTLKRLRTLDILADVRI
jgi:2-methylcitrate dehydratase